MRDDRGRLYGRVDASRLLLEIRRSHETAIFDLRDYLDALRSIDSLEQVD